MSNQRDIENSLIPYVRNVLDALKVQHGIFCEVFRTVAHVNPYEKVELTYTYETVPYFRGHLLVSGLHSERHVVSYWWQTDQTFLWIPKHNHFIPRPNWKLNVLELDIKTSFRITDIPVMTGLGSILCYKFPLVPYNEPELKDFN